MNPLIIIAAVPFEIEPLIASLTALGVRVEPYYCGIGPIAAAQFAGSIQARIRQRHVFYVGTCGVFGSFDKPWLIRASSVGWEDYGLRSGESYAVPDSLPAYELNTYHGCTRELPAGPLVSTATISKHNYDAAEYHSPKFENLELYGLAKPMLESAMTFSPILAVTNDVGPDAHEQWKNWHRAAAQQTAAELAPKIKESIDAMGFA